MKKSPKTAENNIGQAFKWDPEKYIGYVDLQIKLTGNIWLDFLSNSKIELSHYKIRPSTTASWKEVK